jgi:hypothetical protein
MWLFIGTFVAGLCAGSLLYERVHPGAALLRQILIANQFSVGRGYEYNLVEYHPPAGEED